MRISIRISSKKSGAHAEGVYLGSSVIVKAGGVICGDFAEHIKGGKEAKTLRADRTCVSPEGVILKDCEFNSPSTAAQFVTGRSTNGYEAWKVENKVSLGKYLQEKGLRE